MKHDTLSDNSANSQTNTNTYIPCVRYGFPVESDNPRQAPRVVPITDPIPEGAETVSPVYPLSEDQFQRQAALENPYQVVGAKSIATALQDECETEDRVIYPIYIESDTYPEYGPEPLIEWFRMFVRDELGIAPEECTYYYSGNRSIHVHVPAVVASESERERLKDRVKQFCETTGAKFDLGLYSVKRQFRLPGVRHETTGFHKIRIEPEWDHDRIIQTATGTPATVPETYADILATVFGPFTAPDTPRPSGTPRPMTDILALFGGPDRILTFSEQEPTVEVPLVEQRVPPSSEAALRRWEAYNDKEFSPYAKAGNGERSVAVVKVLGSPFARKEVRNGAPLVPAYFYGAHGCEGREFTKFKTHAPLQLSKRDLNKWDYDSGDRVVIIGGASRYSRIFAVDSWTAVFAGHLLHPEDGNRQDALAFLADQGYDVGNPGRTGREKPNKSRTRRDYEQVLPATNPRTEAGELQRRAEQEGIETLTHEERWRVASRLLYKYEWEPVWRWFQKQFGDDFKPDVTWTQLKSVVETNPDGYSHVEVPDRP